MPSWRGNLPKAEGKNGTDSLIQDVLVRFEGNALSEDIIGLAA